MKPRMDCAIDMGPDAPLPIGTGQHQKTALRKA